MDNSHGRPAVRFFVQTIIRPEELVGIDDGLISSIARVTAGSSGNRGSMAGIPDLETQGGRSREPMLLRHGHRTEIPVPRIAAEDRTGGGTEQNRPGNRSGIFGEREAAHRSFDADIDPHLKIPGGGKEPLGIAPGQMLVRINDDVEIAPWRCCPLPCCQFEADTAARAPAAMREPPPINRQQSQAATGRRLVQVFCYFEPLKQVSGRYYLLYCIWRTQCGPPLRAFRSPDTNRNPIPRRYASPDDNPGCFPKFSKDP
jgi:hypothetical protein